MAGAVGLEPTTAGVTTRCTCQERFTPLKRLFCHGLGKPPTSAYVTIGNHVLLIEWRAE